MRSHLYSWLKFIIGLPLTIVALFFILRTIISQAPTLLSSIHTIHYSLLISGIISFIIYYFVRSFLWYTILRKLNYSIPFKQSNYLWATANLKRYIPGNIWAFLSATVTFNKVGIHKKDIGKSFIIEAELFVIGSSIVSLLALPFYFSKEQKFEAAAIVICVLLVSFLFCIGNSVVHNKLKNILKFFSFLLSPFTFYTNTFLLWLSIIALFFFGLGNYLVITAVLFLNPKLFLDFLGIFDFAFVMGYLSIVTPAGFGVREGIVAFSLLKVVSSGLAAFSALFSRIILICSELLFIGLSAIWLKIHDPGLTRLEKIITTYPQVCLVSILSVIYFIYFTVVSFFRYDNFYTGRFDLGNMAQTVWNTLHGRVFLLTDPNGTQQISRLAFHADFILILLTPFYAIWQNPKMLLLIQTFVVAAGAMYLYIIARDVLKSRNLGLTLAFAYLINPSVERANIFDFHAVTLVTAIFFGMYYYFLKKNYTMFFIFAILAALCKEQIWLIIALFGLLVFFIHKRRIIGASLFIVSLGMFYYLIWIAIPQTLGAQHFALAYFSDYGDSPTQVVKGIVLSPNKLIQTILDPDRLAFLNTLFMPVGYLILLFPFFLIFAGPDLLIDLLSNNPQLHQIYYQYTTTITPFVFLGTIYAISWIRNVKINKKQLTLHAWNFFFIVYVLAFSLYSAYVSGPLPGAIDPNLDMFDRQQVDRSYIDKFLSKIPKKDSVSASNDIGSHLSSRENIYTIPYGLDSADIVTLLITDDQTKAAFDKISEDPHYKEIAQKDNFVAFKRL